MKSYFALYFQSILIGFITVALIGMFIPNFVIAENLTDKMAAGVSIVTCVALMYFIVHRITVNLKELKASKPKPIEQQTLDDYDYRNFDR